MNLNELVNFLNTKIGWDNFDSIEWKLPVKEHKLISLIVSAYKKDESAALRAYEEYLSAGGESKTLLAAGALLLSSRGRSAINTLGEVILPYWKEITPESGLATPTKTEFVEIPVPDANWSHLLNDHQPKAIKAYLTSRHHAWNQDGLSMRLAHLILVALNTSDYISSYAKSHAKIALDHGATSQDVVEAAALVIPIAGVTAWHSVGEDLSELLAARTVVE